MHNFIFYAIQILVLKKIMQYFIHDDKIFDIEKV